MRELYFIVEWDSIKERTWSGTIYGLYKTLSRRFNIKEVEVSLKSPIVRRIFRKLGILKGDLSFKDIKRERKKLSSENIGVNPLLQFAEIVDPKLAPNNYIYQDLSVPFIYYLSQSSPEVYAYSGFAKTSIDALKARTDEQMKYYQTCRGIFTMGEWLKLDLINRLGIDSRKVHCVGGGINLDKSLISPQKKNNNKILFVGRNFKRKGGYLVYDAFIELKNKQPDVELHVAGPKVNPISDPISGYYFYGDSDHTKLSELFNMCDIFCMPSYFEAYGLVFIEALCYGLPCIGRNCYEMPYFIDEGVTGLLINRDDVYELSDCMYRLLHNDIIKKQVNERRNLYIEKYSWDAVADRIENVILNDKV